MLQPPKLRLASSQSMESHASSQDGPGDSIEPGSPPNGSSDRTFDQDFAPAPTQNNNPVRVDVSCQRPGEDISAVEDGPLFRATMKALEQKTENMRTTMKKVLKKAEAAQLAQVECNEAVGAFLDSLKEAAASNANAVQPAWEHYFEKIAKEIQSYEKQNSDNIRKLLVEPLTRLYNSDIKQAKTKKRDFEDESREFYAYLGRYLGQRQDSMKEKKRAESDSKYQTKRRNFDLSRFDYSAFMQDLHGGRKEQEVLSHLTKYANAQSTSYLATAKKVEELVPQLDALNREVNEADREYQSQRTERAEKRRTLEKSTSTYTEPDSVFPPPAPPESSPNINGNYTSDTELGRSDSASSTVRPVDSHPPSTLVSTNSSTLAPPTDPSGHSSAGTAQSATGSLSSSPRSNRVEGSGDAEDKERNNAGSDRSPEQVRKEGLLWALSRPGSHVDPKGLNKQAWHKFWIVLDQGKLSEYSNWKQRLDLHMEPIDMRMASVREARNAERRFCFEVITPQYKRIYQATSEEDMNSWISAINNAIQRAVEGRRTSRIFTPPSPSNGSIRGDIASVLTGKSPSLGHGGHSHSSSPSSNNVFRRTTVGARPQNVRTNSNSFDESPDKLLQMVRDVDKGNCWCADCGSGIKTEWVSINLGIVLCIECSGIHRSLGTHISKVRSLTLDNTSFTTDIVEILLQVGNRVSNMVWEARLDRSNKPTSNSTREQRLKFITTKYVHKEYVNPLSGSNSHFHTPDETLLASIKKNDIQGVIYAIALGANMNAADRSRNTHALFLALAAADPALPSPVASSLKSDTSSSVRTVTFPIAEVLLQNGAEIPVGMPAFPLSRSALLYLEQRSGKGKEGTADTIGTLPSVGSIDKTKDKDSKFQKRVSVGSRLVKSSVYDRS